MSCKNYREVLLVGNRLELLGLSPEVSKPMALYICSIANWANSIRWHFNISLGEQSWEEPDANIMPKNLCHRRRSRWNSWLRWMGWSLLRKQHNKSIMRHKNIPPSHTNLVAWCKCPITDSSSCLLYHFWGSQGLIRFCYYNNFSWGRCATWLTQSSSMPSIMSTMGGPHTCQDARMIERATELESKGDTKVGRTKLFGLPEAGGVHHGQWGGCKASSRSGERWSLRSKFTRMSRGAEMPPEMAMLAGELEIGRLATCWASLQRAAMQVMYCEGQRENHWRHLFESNFA